MCRNRSIIHRGIIVLLTALLFFNMSSKSALADEVPSDFDPSWFEDMDTYKYDKFDQTWYSSSTFYDMNDDTGVFIGFRFSGNLNSIDGGLVVAFAALIDDDSPWATSADCLIDGVLYSYPSLFKGRALITNDEEELLIALSKASELSIRLYHEGKKYLADFSAENVAQIRVFALKLLDMDVFKYVVEGGEWPTAIKENNIHVVVE